MIHRFLCLAFGTLLSLFTVAPLSAQDSSGESDGASRQAEESDEAFRRRMELEDARQRDLGYKLPDETYLQKQEKLDKLPEESRENIRDQLVDIIVENGDWEPSDALKEYPYEPTAAAQEDPELMAQEQEAWDEQIEKYHRREAAAFGTYLGPVAGPGNPDGNPDGEPGGETGGGQGGSSDESAARDSEPGGGQHAGSDGGESAGDGGAAGTYEPYRSQQGQSEEAVSTAGVQQSALEFLKGSQSLEPAPSGSAPAADTAQAAAAQATSPASAESDQAGAESAAESAMTQDDTSQRVVDIDLSTPGIIAIEDLDKLEGAEGPTIPPAPESDQP